jgi:hypothetical protein
MAAEWIDWTAAIGCREIGRNSLTLRQRGFY